jgi:hypothetical protein
MTNTQSKAKIFADWLEGSKDTINKEAAKELRRLHKVNQELLESLKLAQAIIGHPDDQESKFIAAVIAKARGEHE